MRASSTSRSDAVWKTSRLSPSRPRPTKQPGRYLSPALICRVTLAGGTNAFTGNVTEGSSPGTGALTLTANSIIDFNLLGNEIINFGPSHLASWNPGGPLPILSIYNWGGSTLGGGNDRLIFGSNSTALTSGQLAQISFYRGAGTGFLGAGTFVGSLGEVVPVPEPSSVFIGLALCALAGWRERRREQRARRATR